MTDTPDEKTIRDIERLAEALWIHEDKVDAKTAFSWAEAFIAFRDKWRRERCGDQQTGERA